MTKLDSKINKPKSWRFLLLAILPGLLVSYFDFSKAASADVEAQPIVYPLGIVINEILPSPAGLDKEGEWIEIFNQNNFEVDLSFWQITDVVGRTNTYTFPEGTSIGPQSFLVLFRPTTEITLNNAGDGLKLIQPNGNLIDSITFDEKAPQNQSFNRIESEWVWSSILTPGSANLVPSKISPAEELKSENEIKKIKLAMVDEQISEFPKSLIIFLIALTLAVFSGVIILILKNKVYNKEI